MRLTSLSLNGFKSFGDRTVVEFSPGITAVIGPNGSGKSNLIDGLRWATGGGRASEFRAGDKRDLIFHGAAGKRSMGFAEVQLEIKLPNKTLHISRSIDKEGNTKLKLDGKNVRFLDLDEALAGTGLGKGNLAVIGQGEVSQVLMADPGKLLSYVAEAADVTRLSSRRDQTEQRLITAREHLQRLDDIMQELERQLELLQAEAEQAARSNELNRNALQLRYTLAYQRVESLKQEVQGLQEKSAETSDALATGREQLAAARTHWQQQRTAVSEHEVAYRQALTSAEVKRGDLRVAEQKLESLKQQADVVTREHAALLLDVQRLQSLSAPQAPQDDIEALTRKEQQQQQTLTQLEAALREQEAALLALEKQRDAQREQQTAFEKQLAAYTSRKEQLEQQLADVTARLSSLAHVDMSALDEQQQALSDVTQAEEQNQTQLESLRAELEVLQQQHAQALAEAQALERAAQRSRAAFESRRGYAQGPKNALTSGIAGILGSVADLIVVPDAYKTALASALGRRAEYIVVDDSSTAQKVLAYVRQAGGWVTLLPLDLVNGRDYQPGAIANEPGFLGMLGDLIDYDARFKGVMLQLLGATALIETGDEATRIAKRHSQRPRFVTLDGDIVEAYGAMTGGRRGQQSTQVIGAAAEVEEAEAQAHDAALRASKTQQQLSDVQVRYKELQARLREQSAKRASLTQSVNALKQQHAVTSSQLEDLNNRKQTLIKAIDALEAPEQTRQTTQYEALNEQVLEFAQRLSSSRNHLREQQEHYATLRQQRAIAIEKQQQYQRDLSRYEQEQQQLAKSTQRLQELSDQREQLNKETHAATEQRNRAEAALPKDLKDKELEYKAAQQHVADAEAEVTRLSETQAQLAEQLEGTKITLARREAALEIAVDELKVFPEGLEVRDLSTRRARELLNETEAELEAIGPVNHRAQQEYDAQQSRYTELRQQTQEATEAVNELESVLATIDKETTSRLNEAIDALKTKFSVYVRQLFGEEAHSDIVVHREEERPTGLTIHLQPPGKQTRNLNLLSVGERTMGAMAFLFSLTSEGQGLPLAILDEVDAPLDEANIRRYCEFLRQLGDKGTQFVLITHQKATFEVADVLWGVTTERGVSRVFSISKAENAMVG